MSAAVLSPPHFPVLSPAREALEIRGGLTVAQFSKAKQTKGHCVRLHCYCSRALFDDLVSALGAPTKTVFEEAIYDDESLSLLRNRSWFLERTFQDGKQSEYYLKEDAQQDLLSSIPCVVYTSKRLKLDKVPDEPGLRTKMLWRTCRWNFKKCGETLWVDVASWPHKGSEYSYNILTCTDLNILKQKLGVCVDELHSIPSKAITYALCSGFQYLSLALSDEEIQACRSALKNVPLDTPIPDSDPFTRKEMIARISALIDAENAFYSGDEDLREDSTDDDF